MSLVPSFTITQQDGGATALAVNTTPYGSPNQDRNQAAEYVLWSKTDQNGLRSFNNPDQGNVLTNLQYSVQTPVDGWYELIRLRIQFYNAGANYVEEQSSGGVITQYASIFYYGTTGKVYQAITPSIGQSPTDTNYFVEVPDLSVILANTNIEVYYQNFYGEYNTNVCIRDKDLENCNCGGGDEALDLLYAQKQSADTNFANGYPDRMEKIIRELEQTCTQC
ncbi:MAG TPA: hypothetical protein VL443_24350 [Cyclobacteriaceae bacterium]|jgi:hypothetical protein|nr:hypothetical protein [Cyclobacteriaceae bacterium]